MAHEQQREHERDDADRAPDRLDPREVAVEARDGHEPDAVQERGERQQRAVGARSEAPHRHVRDDIQRHDAAEQQPEIRRQRRPVGQREQDVPADRDDDGEEPETQLGVPPPPTRRRDADHGPRTVVVVAFGCVVDVGRVVVVVEVVVVVVVATARCRFATI